MYRYNLYKIQNASRYDSQRHALYHLKQYEILKMTTQYLLKIGMFTSSLERPPNSTGKLFQESLLCSFPFDLRILSTISLLDDYPVSA